jgi:hypothetical protein
MSTVACGQPLPLSHIPTAEGVRISGLTDKQLAISLDPLPPAAPVVIRYQPRLPSPVSPSAVVDDVLDKLAAVARDLFPCWLPGARVITGRSDFDRRVVRELAGEKAADSAHFGPSLADVAEAAVCGYATRRGHGSQVRAQGLSRIISDSYGRDGLVLLVGTSPIGETGQRQVATACESIGFAPSRCRGPASSTPSYRRRMPSGHRRPSSTRPWLVLRIRRVPSNRPWNAILPAAIGRRGERGTRTMPVTHWHHRSAST